MAPLVWLVTGCSSGFGEEFVHAILARGDHVIATSRNVADLKFPGAEVFDLDVTAPQETIDTKILGALEIYGHVDVLVNNAGYIEVGSLEETSYDKWLSQFNTNVFGAVKVTQAILPHFRQRRAGIAVFMSSISGWSADAFATPYVGSKFALEGIVESLQKEVAPLGIECLLVEPGYFRTRLLDRPQIQSATSSIDDYAALSQPVHEHLKRVSGKQLGDPKKGVEVIIDVVKHERLAENRQMPLRLPLGSDSIKLIREKCVNTLKLLDDWEDIIRITDFRAGK
ncbi:hypothetical protein AJ79_03715 [Helicocarpus griseus UAMH5409]|uniref:Uncharacterized protein n=1 Tax=Helicocarpus griseus UAMH5409 TaxID=1447875 RepID=A0A2B7XX05_9EURO|nr:hypothetical protein AJ79_03715 [Helicocarpus griseus UAMH5409]